MMGFFEAYRDTGFAFVDELKHRKPFDVMPSTFNHRFFVFSPPTGRTIHADAVTTTWINGVLTCSNHHHQSMIQNEKR
jgi:hypothetical protein